ncbi:hypothetical protein [Novosphingobium sp. KACC 22771]|uniref:hypothetical protein n=1 Tax=Novosphingobium sp. KACC 22771 TaxID=3025670 RepID=UPI0023665361|nr:hypothetical protein [Novosphingobium sp. KACC 22771]WDF71475.1 hypothetical protein PQ467_11725 [Novosphingobium sp. KACC 22771]
MSFEPEVAEERGASFDMAGAKEFQKNSLFLPALQIYCRDMTHPPSQLSTIGLKLVTSSAMNPTLLLCLISMTICVPVSGFLFIRDLPIPASVLLAIGAAPLSVGLWQLIKFTNKDPDRLQREEHNENMLQIRNGLSVKEGGHIIHHPLSQNLTDNPQVNDNLQIEDQTRV